MFVLVMVLAVCWAPFQVLKLENDKFIQSDGSFVDDDMEKVRNMIFLSYVFTVCLWTMGICGGSLIMRENIRNVLFGKNCGINYMKKL